MEIKDLYQLYLEHPSINTDTRRLKAGDIFFALRGSNFNGNDFVKNALEAGASYVITDDISDANNKQRIKTNDALKTLQDLARYHRQQFKIPFLAITGSNGKTTTKELIYRVLSTTYKTYATEGNLNNHIGIPLTILKIKHDAEIAVIEMGANHVKEIEGYCMYAMPTHGLITNLGKAHLEGFGSVEAIRKAKGELFDYLESTQGIAIVNNDDPYLKEMSKNIRHVFSYGEAHGDVIGYAINKSSYLEVEITNGLSIKTLSTQLIGNYNLLNVLAAIAVGKIFHVSELKIKDAIESYIPGNSRSQMLKQGSNTIILDAYNANPSSMKAAIENFETMPGSRKILLLGSMMELGSESKREHQDLVTLINKHKWKEVALVGANFKEVDHRYRSFDNVSQLKSWFKEQDFENCTILIKGSRSMEMEKVLE
jgi:UDP-N-acetylmuramoyl-tripeptide--D-alanyl-D-alanine ligase